MGSSFGILKKIDARRQTEQLADRLFVIAFFCNNFLTIRTAEITFN